MSRASRVLSAVIVLAVGGLGLAGCATAPPVTESTIESLTFHQYQAIENFDDSEHVQDDPTQIARFADLLDEFGVVPGVTVTAAEDNCDGGLSTTVEVGYDDGTSAEMFIADCGEPRYDEFNTSANDLFSQWREGQ